MLKLKLQIKLIVINYLQNKFNEVLEMKEIVSIVEKHLHHLGMDIRQKSIILKQSLIELEKEESIHIYNGKIYKGVNFNVGIIEINIKNFEVLNVVFINEVSLDDYKYTDDVIEYENILDEEEIEAMVNKIISLGIGDNYVEYTCECNVDESEQEFVEYDDLLIDLNELFEDAELEVDEYGEIDEEEEDIEEFDYNIDENDNVFL